MTHKRTNKKNKVRGQCGLPSLILLASLFELLIEQSFGEVVSPHLSRRAGLNNEEMSKVFHVIGVMAHMLPEPVPLDQEVLGTVGDVLLGGKLMGSMIVLEYTTLDSCVIMGFDGKSGCDFKKEVTKRNDSSKTHTQGRILCLCGGKGDLGMKLSFPKERNT